MEKTPTERYGTRLAGWLGIFVSTTIAGPAWFRLSERGFSWPDALLLVAGAFLFVFWAVRLVLLERALRSGAGRGNRSSWFSRLIVSWCCDVPAPGLFRLEQRH